MMDTHAFKSRMTRLGFAVCFLDGDCCSMAHVLPVLAAFRVLDTRDHQVVARARQLATSSAQAGFNRGGCLFC